MKKTLSIILVFSFVAFICCGYKPAAEPDISAQSAVLYDPLFGEFIFEKNADVRRGMASTTKIMTAVIAAELYDLDAKIEIQPKWCGAEGSSMYLQSGERLSVRELLYGLMLASGNDAATALSYIYSGNPEDFVALMNRKARELGLEDTHFDNPSGLDGETHFSTAKDMAMLAAYAMENETVASVAACRSIRLGDRYLKNHNKLLELFEGTTGIKTGFTKACGRCLVSAVQRNGRMFIAVTLNAPDDWNDHMRMYEGAFSGLSRSDIVCAGDLGTVPVLSGSLRESRLYVNEGFSAYLRPEEQARIGISIKGARFCYAPVRAGEPYGELRVLCKDRIIFSTPIYYSDSVNLTEREGNSLWDRIQNIFRRKNL